MDVSLAEIIERRDLLSPREATTLTLAIGREWERQRARRANQALPDFAQIALAPTGGIVFVSTNCGADDHSVAPTLSALLGQLLGLDEEEAPRQHIPGGLLITIAGQLGPVDLPSRDDGFMNALSRFADDEAVLAQVHSRVVSARCTSGLESPRTIGAKVRRGPDRRRQPPAVAALRRAVRDLERQTFEAKALARSRVLTPARSNRRRVATVGGSAAIALLLGAAGFMLGATGLYNPGSSTPRHSHAIRTTTEAPAAPVVHQRIAPERKPVTIRRAVVRPTASKPRRAPATPHRTFIGGARSIAWTASLDRHRP